MKKIVLTLCAVALSFVGMSQTWAPIHGEGFSTEDIYGNPVNVADTLAAGKYIVVDYSCTWCGPCFNFHRAGVLEAIHEQLGDQVCVLWVESDASTTLADIYGTGNNTQGNWTVDANGNPIPYRIIDCAECENMIDPTGYVPAIYFVTPQGNFCHIYGESYGLTTSMAISTAIDNIQTLMAGGPQPGDDPVIYESKIPASGIANRPVTFEARILAYEHCNVSWTFEGGNPSSANGESVTCTWDAPGTYNVSMTATNSDGSVSASGTITINEYAYFFDFEQANVYRGWTTIDADGDGYNWTFDYLRGQGAAHNESNGMMASASWNSTAGALIPDNWVFTPALTIPDEEGVTLEWYEKGQDADWSAEKYRVYVATSPTIDAATEVANYTATDSWLRRTVSLEAYRGQSVYIAFRHTDITDMFMLDIDDIGVTGHATAAIDDVDNITVAVYPNPASDRLNVRAEGLREVEVLDIAGRVVATSATSVVDLNGLSAGVYMVRVITADGTATQKFVKE